MSAPVTKLLVKVEDVMKLIADAWRHPAPRTKKRRGGRRFFRRARRKLHDAAVTVYLR